MIQKSGYYIRLSALVDERVWLALADYANKRFITPDLALEQLVEQVVG
jgi:hypothetical protein